MLTGLHAGGPGRRDRPQPLADLAAVMTRLPQVLINVKGVDKAPRRRPTRSCSRPSRPRRPRSAAPGRVLLRKSGTEPLVRVMVEAAEEAQAEAVAERLAEVVRSGSSL